MRRAISSSPLSVMPVSGRSPFSGWRFRPALLALSIAAAFTSLPIASQGVLPVHKADVVGTSALTYNAARTQLTVTTTNGVGAGHSAINWQSFSIGAGNGTRFEQPNAASMSINRVVSNTPSQIFGTLSSNGKLVLVNQSGITVGAGAVVDTAGFTASVLGMSDADAAAGRLRFNADGLGQANGALVVQGNIIARGGDVVLIAPNVEVAKTAVVEAENGTAILAAGQRVEVTGRGLEGIVLQVQAPGDRAVNLGTLKGDAVGIFAGQLRHSGIIQARGVTLEGGRVVLRATELAEVNGTIEASRTIGGQTTGGSVEISGRIATLNGVIDARGSAGGAVTVGAQVILQGGQIDASGTVAGGSIQLVARDYVEQTASAQARADGGSGAGGAVRVQTTDEGGAILSSATLSADGASGGSVVVAAPSIRLHAATVSAEGTATVNGGGGSIKIGGGRQGNDPGMPNSRYVFINNATNISASSRRSGKGGTVIVWSDGVTRFAGNIFARGGSEAGDGGFVEVSGKESLTFSGMANAGAPHGANGQLLLDPKNIIIQDTSGALTAIGLDPDPEASGTGNFGAASFIKDGKLVVTDPLNDVNANDAGAIYVFDPVSGALLGSLRGSSADDKVGLAWSNDPFNSNHLMLVNSGWGGNTGAISFVTPSAFTGAQVISSANSFVGAAAGDKLGSDGYETVYGGGGTALLFGSPDWGGGKGAILKVFSGDTVRSGVVDATTALVGRVTTDHLGQWGSGTTETTLFRAYYGGGQDQFLLRYSHFDGDRGAVTLGNVTLDLVGEVGDTSKNLTLKGTNAGDKVGVNVMPTEPYYSSTTDWIIASPQWQYDLGGGTLATNAGAVTVIKRADAGNLGSASNGVVSASNSLLGTSAGDLIGGDIRYEDGLGYFLVVSPSWNGDRGSVTWSSLAAPTVGQVSSANSLVGANAGDMVGQDVERLYYSSDAHYVVRSPNWHYDVNSDGTTLLSNAGALTVMPLTGVTGIVSAANSLIGTHEGDDVGNDYLDLNSYGYLVSRTPYWKGGMGAITVMDLANPATLKGAVSAANSLVGSDTMDGIGGRLLDNAGYGYVLSVAPDWAGGKGAVTHIKLSAPATGAVSSTNSLVGDLNTDRIGDGADLEYHPASYTEAAYDTGVEFLNGGNYLVRASQWNNYTGMVAFGSQATGVSGLLDAAGASSIALVGTQQADPYYTGDRLGAKVITSSGGSYLVVTPTWNYDHGAITWGNAATGVKGAVDSSNSLIGSSGSYLGSHLFEADNMLVAISPNWGTGVGAITVLSRTTPTLGYVDNTNSVVGGSIGDFLGCESSCGTGQYDGYIPSPDGLGNNWWAVRSPRWSNGAGAITFFYTGSGSPAAGAAAKNPTGSLYAGSTANISLLGAYGEDLSLTANFSGDALGAEGQIYLHPDYWSNPGKIAVMTPDWNYRRGAVTMLNLNAMTASVAVGASHSLVGTTPQVWDVDGDFIVQQGDEIGKSGDWRWSNDDNRVVIIAPHWDNDKGAVAVTDWTPYSTTVGSWSGNVGVISASTAFVGTVNGDKIGGGIDGGSGLVKELDNGKLLIVSPQWGGARGAASILDMGNVTGTVSSGAGGNSMVGESSGDWFGEGVTSAHTVMFGDTLVLASPEWRSSKGALTWIDTTNPGGTVSSASNSLVGASAGDLVGNRGFTGQNTDTYYSDGEFAQDYFPHTLALSTGWAGSRGAITKITATPKTGTVDATNSFVGDISGGEGSVPVGGNVSWDGQYYLNGLSVFDNGAMILRSERGSGQSFLTVFAPGSDVTGQLSSSNSVQIATSELSNISSDVYGNKLLLLMPDSDGGKGAVRVLDTDATLSAGVTATMNTGANSAANALVGSTANDRVGSGYGSPVMVGPGKYLVGSPHWDGDKGAVTVFDINAPMLGALSSANSLVGSAANDFGGVSSGSDYLPYWLATFQNGNFLLNNRFYGGGQGAITFFDVSAPTTGVVSAANSMLGGAGNTAQFSLSSAGGFGYNPLGQYRPSAYVVTSHAWMGDRGMATVFNQSGAGNPFGDVGASNALVGGAAGDRVGERMVTVGGGYFVVTSESWSAGKGAISWGNVAGTTLNSGNASLVKGVVSAANSLVGSHDGDHVGSSLGAEGYTSPVGQLTGTSRYYVITPDYNGSLGAYTFVNAGTTGTVNDFNGLVGSYVGGLQASNGSELLPQYLGTDRYLLRFGGSRYSAGGPGQIYLSNGAVGGLGPYGGPTGFASVPGQTVTITPQRITDVVNTGTDILLQANNDIVIQAAINATATTAGSGPGAMIFEAGRSIRVHADIDTDGGDLALLANSPNALAEHREAGAGGIFMDGAATINLGGGDLLAGVGTGVDGAPGGLIELGTILDGKGLLARNLSTSAGAGIAQVPGTVWDVEKLGMQTSGPGADIGTIGQSIAFTGNEMAIRTADGSAHVNHLGGALLFATGFDSDAAAPAVDFLAGLDYRGIHLGGQGSLNLRSEGSIYLLGGTTPVSIEAHNIAIRAPNGNLLVGGQNASAEIVARRDLFIGVREELVLHGGSADGAHASIVSAGNADILAGEITLHGGSGNGSYALLDPTTLGSTMAIHASSVSLQGGSGDNAYAAIVSQGGPLTLNTEQLALVAGTGSNADAVILAPNARSLSEGFGSGYLGVGNPLRNGTTDSGFGTVLVGGEELLQRFTADQNLITEFLDRYDDELLRARRRGLRGDIVLEETCR